MPLLRGLAGSLLQLEPRSFTDFAVLDVGLGPENREWAARHAAQVLVPAWDLPIDPQLRARQPHLRALTARPFLPDYFPGYDVYLWMDADTWVQERFALEWYFAAAAQGHLAVAPQVDRAYRHSADMLEWRLAQLKSYFGPRAAQRALWETYVNSGVFALHVDAPHWKLWAKHFGAGLDATNGSICCDQTALNHALWTEDLAVYPLPALCNWLCHLAIPGFDPLRKKFCEPLAPGHLIGILHLAANTKDFEVRSSGKDGLRTVSLRFPGDTKLGCPV